MSAIAAIIVKVSTGPEREKERRGEEMRSGPGRGTTRADIPACSQHAEQEQCILHCREWMASEMKEKEKGYHVNML